MLVWVPHYAAGIVAGAVSVGPKDLSRAFLLPALAVLQPLAKHPEDSAIEATDSSEVLEQRWGPLSGLVWGMYRG